MDEPNAWRSWLEKTKTRGMALGVEATQRALRSLNLGEPTYETVHVAGSNGKGTTVATLSAALTATGIANLAFTSPHLVRVEERVRLNGVPVAASEFDVALATVKELEDRTGQALTFFEITFLVAAVLASRHDIKVLLLETGLGGRLDATRAAPANISVLTALSLEHTEVLGMSLVEIAREKAAIARPSRPLIARRPDTLEVQRAIEACAEHAGSPALNEAVEPAFLEWVEMEGTDGAFEEARRLAQAVWPHLKGTEKAAFPEIGAVHWPARMQRLPSPGRPEMSYLLDGAHNPSGMEKSCELLEKTLNAADEPWTLLIGSSPQSDMAAFLGPLRSLCEVRPPATVVVSVPQGGRYPGVDGAEMAQHLLDAGLPAARITATPAEAIAWLETQNNGVRCVLSIGSLYMQGNVLEALGATDDEALTVRAKV
jgi:dihydrofolate synthase/folylpolyglutamate synthase